MSRAMNGTTPWCSRWTKSRIPGPKRPSASSFKATTCESGVDWLIDLIGDELASTINRRFIFFSHFSYFYPHAWTICSLHWIFPWIFVCFNKYVRSCVLWWVFLFLDPSSSQVAFQLSLVAVGYFSCGGWLLFLSHEGSVGVLLWLNSTNRSVDADCVFIFQKSRHVHVAGKGRISTGVCRLNNSVWTSHEFKRDAENRASILPTINLSSRWFSISIARISCSRLMRKSSCLDLP